MKNRKTKPFTVTFTDESQITVTTYDEASAISMASAIHHDALYWLPLSERPKFKSVRDDSLHQ